MSDVKEILSQMKERAKELGMPRAHVDKFDTAVQAVEFLEKAERRVVSRNARRNP